MEGGVLFCGVKNIFGPESPFNKMNNYHYYQIETQFIENYGAHSEPVNNHWKFKGGQTYFIRSESPKVANAVAFVATYLHGNRQHSIEIPVQWQECSKEYVDSHTGGEECVWMGDGVWETNPHSVLSVC